MARMTEFGSDLILARLQQLHPKSIDLSLARIVRLLERLGHPELQLPPVIHIAGTNGKGSTLAMLDAMLTAAGNRVHRYISPHLVRFSERILLHGKCINEALLANVLDECEMANAGDPITFFEITTAAAFLAFGRVPADYLLLETGLGGRLDATNVVPSPRLCLISPISMDHESYLGTDHRSIASEKAGIIKPGVNVLMGPQRDDVMAVLLEKAAAVGATVEEFGASWHVELKDDRLLLEADGAIRALPRPALRGPHQIHNAGLAALAGLRLGIDEKAIATGLKEARWAARLQPITRGRLFDLLPSGFELWLDGGHNPAAGVAVASSLDEIAPGRPVDLVVGMLETKSIEAFLEPLAGRIDRLRLVPVPDEPASRDPVVDALAAREAGWSVAAANDLESALTELAHNRQGPRSILICGSLYLAGHVLRSLG